MVDEANDLFGGDKFAQGVAEGRVMAGMTEDQVREARRIKAAKWRAENRERAREIGRESMRRAAADKAIAEGRVPGLRGRPSLFTEEERRAKRKAKTEAYNAANIDEVRRKAREREQAKRDGTFVSMAKARLTEEERLQVIRMWSAIRRARLAGNGGTFTRDDLDRLYLEQKGLCLFCGEPLTREPMHVDHWMPVSKGGSSDPDNLALLHQSCNGRKGARLPSEFGLPNSPVPLRQMLSGASDDD